MFTVLETKARGKKRWVIGSEKGMARENDKRLGTEGVVYCDEGGLRQQRRKRGAPRAQMLWGTDHIGFSPSRLPKQKTGGAGIEGELVQSRDQENRTGRVGVINSPFSGSK